MPLPSLALACNICSRALMCVRVCVRASFGLTLQFHARYGMRGLQMSHLPSSMTHLCHK